MRAGGAEALLQRDLVRILRHRRARFLLPAPGHYEVEIHLVPTAGGPRIEVDTAPLGIDVSESGGRRVLDLQVDGW